MATPASNPPTKDSGNEAGGQAALRMSVRDPYLRAANEDDDGYDPYSDRPAAPEPLFERDPWS